MATNKSPLHSDSGCFSNDSERSKDERKRGSQIRVCVRVRPLVEQKPLSESFPRTSPRIKSGITSSNPRLSFRRTGQKSKKSLNYPKSPSIENKSIIDRNDGQNNVSKKQNRSAWDISLRRSSSSVLEQAQWTEPDHSRRTSYRFDRVFDMDCTNASVYDEAVRDVVHSTVEGYHGSVFAYGQTSTGKTYTMQGTQGEPGVIPRAVDDVFACISSSGGRSSGQSQQEEREYLLRVSYLEIYNEQIYDLLVSSQTKTTKSQIRVFESKNEGVVIRGLKEEIVTTADQVFRLIEIGNKNRHTGATKLNVESSRSHSIFRIVIESQRKTSARNNGRNGGRTSLQRPDRISSLSLVDLAGSESVKSTGASGQRRKEGQYINKSLMTLGHVIFKLSEQPSSGAEKNMLSKSGVKNEHIPYRNSKLTRLLQTSLSGDARVCIICNISCLLKNLEETHNTLKFASRAKNIVQKAIVNKVNDTLEDKALLQSYQEEIEALKAQLREAKEEQSRALRQKEEEERKLTVKSQSEVFEASKISLEKRFSEIPDDDAQVLVSAMKNLESFIVSNHKPPNPSLLTLNYEESNDSKDQDLFGGGLSDIDDESMLYDPRRTDAASSTTTHQTTTTEAVTTAPSTPATVHCHDRSPAVEELYRIQGILSKVFKLPNYQREKQVFPPPMTPTTEVIQNKMPINSPLKQQAELSTETIRKEETSSPSHDSPYGMDDLFQEKKIVENSSLKCVCKDKDEGVSITQTSSNAGPKEIDKDESVSITQTSSNAGPKEIEKDDGVSITQTISNAGPKEIDKDEGVSVTQTISNAGPKEIDGGSNTLSEGISKQTPSETCMAESSMSKPDREVENVAQQQQQQQRRMKTIGLSHLFNNNNNIIESARPSTIHEEDGERCFVENTKKSRGVGHKKRSSCEGGEKTSVMPALLTSKNLNRHQKSFNWTSSFRSELLKRAVSWDGFSDINTSGELDDSKGQQQTAGAKTHEQRKEHDHNMMKRIQKLERQLQQAGISVAEDIPFSEARAEVSRIARRMAEIGSADAKEKALREEYFLLEKEMEKYCTAMMMSDEYLEEQKQKALAWENCHHADNVAALKAVRRCMPIHIKNMSETALENTLSPNGKYMSKTMARKFKRINILQLLRTDPAVIARLHPSSLENLRMTGLTLTERRALHMHLKDLAVNWEKDHLKDEMTGRRWTFFKSLKQGFQSSLDAYSEHISQYPSGAGHSCPLLGRQCPVRADSNPDYVYADLGYPEGAVYAPNNLRKATSTGGTNDQAHKKKQAAAVARDEARTRALKTHYLGNGRSLIDMSKAQGSCEDMEATIELIENTHVTWTEKRLSGSDPSYPDRRMVQKVLQGLRLSCDKYAERTGMKMSGARNAANDNEDTRSNAEIAGLDELMACLEDFFSGLKQHMDQDKMIRKSVESLQKLFGELKVKNSKALTQSNMTQFTQIRRFKSRARIEKELQQKEEAPDENDRPTEKALGPISPTGRDRGAPPDILSAIQGGRGRGHGRGRGRGGRGGPPDLLEAIRRREKASIKHQEVGAPPDLMEAIRQKAAKTQSGTAGPPDLMEAIRQKAANKKQPTGGPPDLMEAIRLKAANKQRTTAAPPDLMESIRQRAANKQHPTGGPPDLMEAIRQKAANKQQPTGAAPDLMEAIRQKAAKRQNDTAAPPDLMEAIRQKAAKRQNDTAAPPDLMEAIRQKAAKRQNDTAAPPDLMEAIRQKAAKRQNDTAAPPDLMEAIRQKAAKRQNDTAAPPDLMEAIRQKAAKRQNDTAASPDLMEAIRQKTANKQQPTGAAPPDLMEAIRQKASKKQNETEDICTRKKDISLEVIRNPNDNELLNVCVMSTKGNYDSVEVKEQPTITSSR